jgi:hypothetical protein
VVGECSHGSGCTRVERAPTSRAGLGAFAQREPRHHDSGPVSTRSLAGHRVLFRTATEWIAMPADIPFDAQAANLMFMLVGRRYERPSLIVTSNKPFSVWTRSSVTR